MSDSIITIGYWRDGTPIRKRIPDHISDNTPSAKAAQKPLSRTERLLEQMACARLNRPHSTSILLGAKKS